jgi:transposase-like protein
MYQGGCSQRDIAKTLTHLLEGRYTASYVSRVVSVVEEKIKEFNERKIEKWYPFVYLDGTYIKIRRDVVEGEVVYIALGIDEEGYKEVIGFWIPGSDGESARLWKQFLYQLKERGLKEPLLFIGDGLKGLKEAVKEVYPLADFQSCILHKVRGDIEEGEEEGQGGISSRFKEDLQAE